MKKVIGFQLTNRNHELPNGLWSFNVFKTLRETADYYRSHRSELRNRGFFISIVREGDIEEPIYIH